MITTSLELALLVLCVEFGLIAVVIMFVSRRSERQQQNEAVENVTSLVATVEKTEVHRRDALMATMQEIYRMDADESEKVVADFIERERAFYNALIGVTLGRGDKSLADVPAEVTKLVAPWVRITPRGQVDKAEVTALQDTNSALEMELSDTKKVLDSLMAEYSAAFDKQQADEISRKAASMPHDELLSIDDMDMAAPEPVVAPPPPPPFQPADVVIDLDGPDEPAEATSPLSQADLDALLENLDDDLFSGKPRG